MDIKNFLESEYNYERFKEFIFDKFYGFEENDLDYEHPLNETEQKHIQKYKFIGSSDLDDGKEVGFFEVITTEKTDIENNRVSLGNILKSKASNELLDSAIAVFYNPNQPEVWRLSFIKFSYDDNNKEQISNLKRFTYVLGNNIPVKTAYNQLKDLKYPSLVEIEESFSVEKISKEFFTKYKELYHKLVSDIAVANGKENKSVEDENNHNKSFEYIKDEKITTFYIKKLLGRIVFLYFVQKKGWLNNDRRFLSNLFFTYTKENPNINFYDVVLEDLFFNALNTKREDNKIILGSKEYEIPYLNGGLFEEDEYDKTDLTISNEDLKQVLELFDSYNFTVIEDTPHDSEIAIDPEMLGRVFEDLLEDRKEKGAFYTPREIVHYMCQQSIINYLLNFYSENNLEDIKLLVIEEKTDTKFIKNNAKDIKKYLEDIKVLDPAIGSGAFPMGMLHEIVSILSNLDKTADNAQLKRKVIENSIYGVDIEDSAVEIAKLRFWLSIVVDEDVPQPLPNLRYKIMVGNSLLETIDGFDPLEISKNNKGNGSRIKRMKNKFHSFFNASTNEKKISIRADIENNVDEIFGVALRNYQKELEVIISKNDLFNTNLKLQKEHLKQVERVSLIKKILNEYKDNRFTTELFLYKIYFAEVIENGGFDIVIGNPPYVRHEKISELKPKLVAEEYLSYVGTADIYVYFFEKGFNLLKENGYLSYITSNKYSRANYGKNLRSFILEHAKICDYIDFNGVRVFESATVDTSILGFKKQKVKEYKFTFCDINDKYKKNQDIGKFIESNSFLYLSTDLSNESFSFSNQNDLKIKKHINTLGIALKELNIKINRGLVTGDNKGLVLTKKEDIESFVKYDVNNQYIKKYVFGKDISRYSYNVNKYLISIPKNTKIYEDNLFLQKLKERDENYNFSISKRKEKGSFWYDLRGCSFYNLFDEEIIVWSDIVKTPTFTLTNKEVQVDTSAYFLFNSTNDLSNKYLLAFLNSKLSYYYMKLIASALGSGSLRWKKLFVEQIPIKIIDMKKQIIFEKLVDYIIFLKKTNSENFLSNFFENVVDVLIYELYFKEELHSKGFGILEILESELATFDGTIESIEKVYKKLSDKNHKVAYNVNFIDTLDIVKTIENKQ